MEMNADPIFVAFEGTTCVGKSKVYDTLAQEFEDDEKVYFLPEASRVFIEENNLDLDILYSVAVQSILQQITLKKEEDGLNRVPLPRVIAQDRCGISAAV